MATRYRDLQRPTLLQTGIVDNSAAQKAEALAGAFKSFERAGTSILGDLSAQQGAQVGAQQGAAGTPEPKTGWRALTRYGDAYNSAAEVTYSNKMQTDIHERMSQLEAESEADPVKFQALSSAYRNELIKTVPPEYSPRVGLMLDARTSAGTLRVGEQAVQKTQRTAIASHLDSADTRIAAALEAVKGLPPAEGDALIAETVAENSRQLDAMPWIDPVQRVQMEHSFVKDFAAAVTNQKVGTVVDEIGQVARTDTAEADKLLASVEDRQDLSPEEKNDIRAKAHQQRSLLESERSHLYYKDVAALTQRLSRDEYGVGIEREADRLYRLAAISDAEYKSYMGASASNADRVIKENARAHAAQGVLYLGGQLDPANPEHRKGVSTTFDNEVARLGVSPGDERWTQMALQLTKQSNILPESAESWARVALLSGDPLRASQAAGFMDQLKRTNPGAYEWQKEPKLAAFSGLFTTNLAAGIPADRAYEMAYKNSYEVSPAEAEVRDREYSDLVRKDPHDSFIKDAFTQEINWGFDKKPPPAPAALKAEYDTLTHEFFTASGDLTQARDLATAQVKSRWGVTEVNGAPEFTRYPIEQTYGFPADFIRADLAQQAKGVTEQPVRLVQNRNTNSTRGLEWGVEVQKPDGAWDVLRGPDNRPARYVLPMSGKQFDDSKQRFEAVSKEQLKKEQDAARVRDAVTIDALRQASYPGVVLQ